MKRLDPLAPARGTAPRGRWLRYIPVAMTLVAGVGLAGWLFASARAGEQTRLLDALGEEAAAIRASLQRSIGGSLEVLHALGEFFAVSGGLDREQFGRLASSALARHPELRALSWSPSVAASRRAAFEVAARAAHPGFEIWEFDPDKRRVRAGQRDEYFPLLYNETTQRSQALFGFDLASDPKRRTPMLMARGSEEVVASEPVTLLLGERGLGILAFQPVFDRGGGGPEDIARRQGVLRGFLVGVLQANKLLGPANRANASDRLEIYVYDVADDLTHRLIFQHPPAGNQSGPSGEAGNLKLLRSGPHREILLTIEGMHWRRWVLLVRPTPAFLAAHITWRPWGLLAAAVLCAGLLGIYLLTTLGRTAEVERLVINRTRELSQARQVDEAMASIARDLAGSLNQPEVLRRMAEHSRALTGSDLAFIATGIEAEGEYRVGTVSGSRTDTLPGLAMGAGRGLGGVALATGAPACTEDYVNDPRVGDTYHGPVREEGVISLAVAPIRGAERTIALLYAGRRTRKEYTEADIALLTHLADHAAIALANARLYQAAADMARRQRALLDVGAALNAASAREGTLQLIVDKAVETLGTDKGALFRYDPATEELSIVAAHGLTPEGMALRLRKGEGAVGRAILGTRPVVIPDTETDTEHGVKVEHTRHEGLRAFVVIPLLAEDEILGTLNLYNHQPTRFGDDELALMTLFGHQAAVALTNARLFEQLARQTSALEAEVAERRRAEVAIVRAREDAERANRAKSEFLAVMSHEIRTPMNGVMGMTGLLLDTELTADQREYAETVRHSAEALLTIINDILDFSKIEAGRLELEVVPFDLRRVVEDVAELLADRAQTKGLELACALSSDLPETAQGDPGRLRQILLNLAGNAVKFTERGEVIIEATVAEATAEAVWLRFSVRDTGIGIPPDTQARLFQPFSQADASTTRSHGGTGLGLAIAKRLVELMGGAIGVESVPGQGSTFWFTARLARAAAPPVAARADLRGLRVLIVDDNATNRRILAAQFASWGLAYGSAADGPTALAEAARAAGAGAPYDLTLLDMQMPGMDGLELARALRVEPALAGLRLILLTSLGTQDRAALEAAGIAACLTKPIRQSQLFDCLATVLAEAPAASRPRRSAADPRPPTFRGRVLVVEDNAVNQRVIVRLLEKRGLRADVAANGLEAVAGVEGIPYDLVLMDCQMPEMDGFAATAAIRQREGTTRHIPIIALTANAMQGDRERCLAAGMDDYLPKPLTVEVLDAALARWLSPMRNAAALAPAHGNGQDGDESKDPAFRIPHSSPVDRARALARAGGDETLLRELAAIFVQDAPDHFRAIQDALARADAPALARAAHTLKGAAALFGAAEVTASAARLEQMGMDGDLGQAAAAGAALEAALACLTPPLVALVQEDAPCAS